jgi:hypothetical protein
LIPKSPKAIEFPKKNSVRLTELEIKLQTALEIVFAQAKPESILKIPFDINMNL